jgi:hypothetical protein
MLPPQSVFLEGYIFRANIDVIERKLKSSKNCETNSVKKLGMRLELLRSCHIPPSFLNPRTVGGVTGKLCFMKY